MGPAHRAPRAPATTRRIIALQPALDFSRMQPAAAAIADLRDDRCAAQCSARGARDRAPHGQRRDGARGALERESRRRASARSRHSCMVALVLYASLRSWRLLAVSLLTLVVGLALTAAFAALAVGQLNLLSVAFVVLNVGLGSDYVIHVLLRYRELTAAGQATPAALVETVRGVGSSLVLCAVTTAAGFYSFIPTTFSGVSELGLIAGTGVFFGLFVSVTLLPALVAWWDAARPGRSAATWLDPRIFAPLEPATAARARRDGSRTRRGARRIAAGHVRQQPDPLARSRQRVGHDVARARRSRRGAAAESRGRRARSRDGARLGDGAAHAARGARRHDDRRARSSRPGREARAARGSRAADGPRLRRARAFAGRRRRVVGGAGGARVGERDGAGGARVARRCGALARAARCGRRRGARRDAGATRRRVDYAVCRASSRVCAPRSRRKPSIASICRPRSRRAGSRAAAASSSRSRRPRTSATTRPRGVSSPPSTPSCRRRRGCPSCTKKRRRRSWRRSSARCSMRSSWWP